MALVAAITKITVRYVFVVGIQVIDYHTTIALVTGSENNNLIKLRELLEAFNCKWSDVDACLCTLTIWKDDSQQNIVRYFRIFITMDQSLV